MTQQNTDFKKLKSRSFCFVPVSDAGRAAAGSEFTMIFPDWLFSAWEPVLQPSRASHTPCCGVGPVEVQPAASGVGKNANLGP